MLIQSYSYNGPAFVKNKLQQDDNRIIPEKGGKGQRTWGGCHKNREEGGLGIGGMVLKGGICTTS
jgi:hypothetical protein